MPESASDGPDDTFAPCVKRKSFRSELDCTSTDKLFVRVARQRRNWNGHLGVALMASEQDTDLRDVVVRVRNLCCVGRSRFAKLRLR